MNQARRFSIALLATVIIAAGVLLSFPLVPGPGILIFLLGLTLLAREFTWADELLTKIKSRWRSQIEKLKKN